MPANRSVRTVLSAVVLAATPVVTVGGCGSQPPQASSGSTRAVARGTPVRSAIIIDADPHGAVLLDGQGRYVGVSRDGTVVWREPGSVRPPSRLSCLARCPDAVLSAASAANAQDVADPAPRIVIGGQWRTLSTVTGHHRRILAATSAEDFVLASGDSHQWSIELHQAGSPARKMPVAGSNPSWQATTDDRHALAIMPAATGNEARWFARTDSGWQQAGAATSVAGSNACLAPDGSRALLLGQRPTVVDRYGIQRPWTDLEAAGTCDWAASGGIVAELAYTNGGLRSRLRAFDAAGTVRWRLDVAAEASVTADPTRSRVAYRVDGVLHEIDPERGVELRTMTGVQAARYDAGGDLVTVSDTGAAVWQR